jgi:molybdenum cofactor cytidylyltransferase
MPNVGAVILAAGESSRLGRPKQLIQLGGRTLAQRVVNAAANAECWPIVVVVGSASSTVARDLNQTEAVLVQNEHWRNGVGTSIREGVRRLIDAAPELEAVVLLVCDQPLVDAMLIKRLILRRTESRKPIIACSYADTLGVPALFDRIFFKDLLALPDDCGAKPVIFRNGPKVAEISFSQGEIDIDTAEDIETLITERNGSN